MEKIAWWRTHFGDAEIRRVTDAISHEHISQGEITARFESALADVLGVPYVVATTSGSMSLLMALMAAGVGRGDEVIVPNRTWIATAHAPFLLGAKVVFADVHADKPILDVAHLEELVTSKTRAIIPVHLNGRAVDMDAINALAHRHGLAVIEDAAQAFAARDHNGMLGTRSDMGCFSLSVAKLISTGQGGFVATRDEHLYRKLKSIRTHGVNDVIHAQWSMPGFNFRFTDIQAAIGLAQLDRLNERIASVTAIHARYALGMAGLSRVRLLPVYPDQGEIPIYVEALCAEREQLIRFLELRDIDVRPFYPDLHVAAYFGNAGEYPHSRQFSEQGVFLPCGPAQPVANIDRVLAALREFENHSPGQR
ncbi:MAG TPA: DegT/DnrJ/EryC1/StrS family aminotransferase [Novimethylophilus sp.]|jgi:dTDP-4-amino-4,6-dideoxygalactose transaminase|uniref:DegT/DnrJ/EryC1/StrS family aminotransferase n=1 Tax=Novimethylophilus sp. TaxID=2137426 RepID=UPI002F4031C6